MLRMTSTHRSEGDTRVVILESGPGLKTALQTPF